MRLFVPVVSRHGCLEHGDPWAGCCRHVEQLPYAWCPECWRRQYGGEHLEVCDTIQGSLPGVGTPRGSPGEAPITIYEVRDLAWRMDSGAHGVAPCWVRVSGPPMSPEP